MLPKVFAIYRRETETFQMIQIEKDEHGEIQRLKGWMRPEPSTWHDLSEEQQEMWFIGQEWYVEPTGYKGASPILYSCNLHDKAYTWWSAHHKLVWSNSEIYKRRDGAGLELWNACHSIPILEFNTKRIYPREYADVYARWASATPHELVEELEKAHVEYIASTYAHVDPSELRIETPKEKPSSTYKRHTTTQMASDTDTDGHEWDTEFTPAAPKHVRVGKQLDYMYDSQDELEQSWAPCVALSVLGACLLGTWSLIGFQLMGY